MAFWNHFKKARIKMNILIVSLFPLERNTSVANSSISIINGLLELNHQVTIVMPNWPQNETECDLSRLCVIRVPGQPDQPYVSRSKLCGKLHSHFDLLDVTRGYMAHIDDVCVPDEYYDVVLSFSDSKTSHVFTSKLLPKKKIRYGRWIQHWGDPILGDITRNFWWPKWAIKLYESRLIRKADKAVYVTPFTHEMLLTAYPSLRDKLAFVPLPAEMLPIVNHPKSEILRISYLGDYNPAFRNLRPLYEACADMESVELKMAGHGPQYPKCTNVLQLPRVPQQQARQIEDESDVLVCICNKTGTQIPGKIMYKTSTDKHILVAVEKDRHDEMVAYLQSFDRFIICDNTEESIRDAIMKIKTQKVDYKTPERLLPVNVAREILK